MKTGSLSDQARIDAFCRDLALALRRISGRVVDIDPDQLPEPPPKSRRPLRIRSTLQEKRTMNTKTSYDDLDPAHILTFISDFRDPRSGPHGRDHTRQE